MKYGEWANTALEAASLGKLVISNTLSADIYEREYGNLGIHIANDAQSLAATIARLVKLNKEQLVIEKKKSRKWAVENHSLEANAIRLWERIYCNFFHGERKATIEQTVNNLREEMRRMV
jgi:glycosyltransferase involved in cell wall biosynthesis